MAKLLIGNLRPPIATTTNPGISKPDGTTIGVDDTGTLSSLVKASGLNVTDTQGIVVPKVEEVAQETTMQALIDAVANKVMNQLVSNSTLATTLADYVTKAMIKTEFEDSDETVPASSLVNQLNSDMKNHFIETNIDIGSSITVQVMNSLYIFGTAFPRPDGQSLAIVFGGNEGQVNSGQTARVVELSDASNISYSVSNVSGKYNQVTVTNNTGYSIKFYILTLGNVNPTIV